MKSKLFKYFPDQKSISITKTLCWVEFPVASHFSFAVGHHQLAPLLRERGVHAGEHIRNDGDHVPGMEYHGTKTWEKWIQILIWLLIHNLTNVLFAGPGEDAENIIIAIISRWTFP